MPWPKEVYQLSIDHDKQQIVLRTANKKYYKRIEIPELKRLGIALDDKQISWKYSNETLLITYLKPEVVMKEEVGKV